MRTVSLIALFSVAVVLLTPAGARGQGHGSHPPMPNQQYTLSWRLDGAEAPPPKEIQVALPSPTTAAQLNQVIELPAPLGSLQLTHYLPRAKVERDVVPDESAAARPAVRLSLNGPSQSYDLWLVADDPRHNRLVSLIGAWRYMAVADDQEREVLFRLYKNEMIRPPVLRIRSADGGQGSELEARVGASRRFEALGCTVHVREFYPHFSYNRKTGEPTNESDKRFNPAALIELQSAGKKEERWVFSRFPDYEMKEEVSLPFHVTLDCPTGRKRETPDFAIVVIDRRRHEVWIRHEGKTTSMELAADQHIEVPNSNYEFHITRFVSSGRLTEEYLASAEKGAVTALQISTLDASGKPATVWLELGKQRVIDCAKGRLFVRFDPAMAAPPRQHHGTSSGVSP